MRRIAALFVLLMTGPALAQSDFPGFLAGLKAEAVASGVSASAYDALTSGLTPDPRVPKLVETQPEFTTPVWDYIETRVNSGRISRGRAALERNAQLFSSIGQHFGVDPYLLGAIWGIETDHGAVLGNTDLIRPIVRSLATVTFQHRSRYAEDKADFFAALRLAERNGGVSPIGHPAPVPTYIDSWLRRYEVVWAAAGHPAAVFSTTYDELVALTGATEIEVD